MGPRGDITAVADGQAGIGFRVGLLGPVEVAAGPATYTIAQPGVRALLSLLALSANRVVPTSVLISGLWEEDPSPQRERNLHAQVYQLRRRLAEAEPGGGRLIRRDPGYQLVLGPSELDLTQFTVLAGRGRLLARSGDHAAAADVLGQALALWRGPALADVVDASARLAADAAALEDQQLAAAEDLAAAQLELGMWAEAASYLAGLVAQHPLRERLRGLLMLSLYRSGRQADALECYQQARLQLADELGIDPSPQLQEMHQRILQADPALLPAAAAPAAVPTGPVSGRDLVVPRQLPAGTRYFAGREAELKWLDEVLAQAAPGGTVLITAIAGTGGVGKTALALHWAHRIADRFPDGQLHVNLRGYDPAGSPLTAAEAIRRFLESLAVPANQLPPEPEAQAALYRSMLAGRRMLIVLDNANEAQQVRALLPAAPGCLVIVTSRSSLAGLVTADGAIPVALDVVSSDEAAQLLAARLGPERLAAEPAAADRLISLSARLPLALAVIGARAALRPTAALGQLADQMTTEHDRLEALETGDVATSIRAVLSWSYRQLSESAAGMFRLVGVHCGPDITAAAAASLAAVTTQQARHLLTELTSANLLSEQVSGRYTFHDLLRAYASWQATQTDPAAERDTALVRSLDHYLHTTLAAALALRPPRIYPVIADVLAAGCRPEQISDRDAAAVWFRSEMAVLLAAAAQAAGTGHDRHAFLLARLISAQLVRDCRVDDDLAICQLALTAAQRLGDDAGAAVAAADLGSSYLTLGLNEQGAEHYRLGLERADRSGDQLAQGYVRAAWAGQNPDEQQWAERFGHAESAADLFRAVGHRHGEAKALSTLGYLSINSGAPAAGRDYNQQAADLYAELGAEEGQATSLMNLAYSHFMVFDHKAAIATYLAAIAIMVRLDIRGLDMAAPYYYLGESYQAAGDTAAARKAWQETLDQLGDLDYYQANKLRNQARQGLEALDAQA